MDTEGLPIEIMVHSGMVHSGAVQDRDGARLLLRRAWDNGKMDRLVRVWADQGYNGVYKGSYEESGCKENLASWVWRGFTVVLQVVERLKDEQGQIIRGFHPLPRRWVVERSFAWLGRYRRLSRDYEFLPASSEAMIHLAFSRTMLRRLVKLRATC